MKLAQISLKLPVELRQRVRVAAAEAGIKQSEWLIILLTKATRPKELKNGR